VGTGDPMGNPYPHGYEYGVNPYPPAYMGNLVGLFLCRRYGYGVVIPGGYLPIAISTYRVCRICTDIPCKTSECIYTVYVKTKKKKISTLNNMVS
jgi:hypothetical protein